MIMKIDFKQFPMYTGIDKKEMVACDVAYSLANNLYTKVIISERIVFPRRFIMRKAMWT